MTMGTSAAPKISIVTVCLNARATIERTLESVLAQTYPNIEHIVIDGGSTDGTREILERYRNRLVYWASEPDGGIYDAMNKGIGRASGEWIHILNSDDYYHDGTALSRAASTLDPARTNYFSMFLEYREGRRTYYRFRYNLPYLYISAKLPHPALIVSREQYRAVGLYDTGLRIAADHDLILRLVRRYPPKFVDFPLVVMDQEGRSARNLKTVYREFRDVTVRHGLPRAVAELVYLAKRLRWGV